MLHGIFLQGPFSVVRVIPLTQFTPNPTEAILRWFIFDWVVLWACVKLYLHAGKFGMLHLLMILIFEDLKILKNFKILTLE